MRSSEVCSSSRLPLQVGLTLLAALSLEPAAWAEPTPVQNSQVPDPDATYQAIEVPQNQANFYGREFTNDDFGANPDQFVRRLSLAITPDLRDGVYNDVGFRLASVFRVNGQETPVYRAEGRCQPYVRFGTTNQIQYQCVGGPVTERVNVTHFTLTTGTEGGRPGVFLKTERLLLFTPAPAAEPFTPVRDFGLMSDLDWTPAARTYFIPFAETRPLSVLEVSSALAPAPIQAQRVPESGVPVPSLW